MDDIEEIEIRFWEKVDCRGPDECWPWLGCVDRDGYGRLRLNGRPIGAHRISYALARGGAMPKGLSVLHSCDTPACVNPAHLRAGTQKENMAERDAKGRGVLPKNRWRKAGAA